MWRARRRGDDGPPGGARARAGTGARAHAPRPPARLLLLAALASAAGFAGLVAGPHLLPDLLSVPPPARVVALGGAEPTFGRAAPLQRGDTDTLGAVTAVVPARGPRAGGYGVLVRGTGFESEAGTTVEGRWRLQAFVGEVPCVRTRWVAPGAVRCVVPPGAGLHLDVTVRRCTCPKSEAHWHLPTDAEGRAPSTPPRPSAADATRASAGGPPHFHFDEDVMASAASAHHSVAPPWANATLLAQRKDLVAPTRPGGVWGLRGRNPVTGTEFVKPVSPAPASLGSPAREGERLRELLEPGDLGKRYGRCAVVGQSPRLKGSRLGATIDELDAVFRVDESPSGHHTHWNRDVGNRTTFQVLGSESAKNVHVLVEQRGEKPPSGGAGMPWGPDQQPHVVLWGPDAELYFSALQESRHATGAPWRPSLLAPGVVAGLQSYLERLHSAAGGASLLSGLSGGKVARVSEGGGSVPPPPPTSLLQAAVLAVQLCESVEVFGGLSPCQRSGSAKCRRAYHEKWAPADVQTRAAGEWEQLALVALGEAGLVDLATPTTTVPFEETWEGRFGPRAPPAPPGASVAPPAPPPPPSRSEAGFCDEGACQRACSNRGRFVRTPEELQHPGAEFFIGGSFRPGCECDPLFAGVACEKDLLEAGPGAALVAGLTPHFSGELLLTKASARRSRDEEQGGGRGGGKTKGPWYEAPLQRDPAGRSFYHLHHTLYNVLPERDRWFRGFVTSGKGQVGEREVGGGSPPPPTFAFNTCAVVGNSGALTHARAGPEIDAHDVVWRFNQAPTAGFEEHAGARTTHEGVNSFWLKVMVDYERGRGAGAGRGDWDDRAGAAVAVFFELFDPSAFRDRGPEEAHQRERMWQSHVARFEKLRREKGGGVNRGGHAELLLVSPAFVGWAHGMYADLKDRLEESLGAGRFGVAPKPESGFLATLLLHQVCEHVDVFGFSPHRDGDRGDPSHPAYHYFDDAVPRRGSHAFGLSLAAFRALSAVTGGAISLRG